MQCIWAIYMHVDIIVYYNFYVLYTRNLLNESHSENSTTAAKWYNASYESMRSPDTSVHHCAHGSDSCNQRCPDNDVMRRRLASRISLVAVRA